MVDAAAADRHMMALSREVDEDIAVLAGRLGFDVQELHEAADGRGALMFHTVIDPHQWPGPNAADAIGGAWLHGALCGAAAHLQAGGRLPDRQAQAADLLEAIRSYEAQCQETGDSKRALARFGLNRDRDQTALAERALASAVELLQADHPMTGQSARQLLGLIALDGMAVARNALDRLARDPSPANPTAEQTIERMRDGREHLDAAFENLLGVIDELAGEEREIRERTKRGERINQPLRMLPAIAELIESELEHARDMYGILSQARPKPQVLDDATLDRVKRQFRSSSITSPTTSGSLRGGASARSSAAASAPRSTGSPAISNRYAPSPRWCSTSPTSSRKARSTRSCAWTTELGLKTLLGLIPLPSTAASRASCLPLGRPRKPHGRAADRCEHGAGWRLAGSVVDCVGLNEGDVHAYNQRQDFISASEGSCPGWRRRRAPRRAAGAPPGSLDGVPDESEAPVAGRGR